MKRSCLDTLTNSADFKLVKVAQLLCYPDIMSKDSFILHTHSFTFASDFLKTYYYFTLNFQIIIY